MNKSGYLTTEFWLTLIAQVLPILVTAGAIGPGDVSTLEGTLTKIVTSAATVLGATWVLVSYIKGRTETKKVQILAASTVLQPIVKVET